jgi:hypothetical protein
MRRSPWLTLLARWEVLKRHGVGEGEDELGAGIWFFCVAKTIATLKGSLRRSLILNFAGRVLVESRRAGWRKRMESCVKGIAGSCVGGAEMAQAQWPQVLGPKGNGRWKDVWP